MGEDKKDTLLDMVGRFKTESEGLRSQYDDRWAKNQKLVKGISDEANQVSQVRKHRSKLFFRKIWATGQRMVAAFYNQFLRDYDNFKISGRDTVNDPHRAKILHKIVQYRRDFMMRKRALFLKFIWAFQDIVHLGWAVGLLRWNFSNGKDEPEFLLFPPEQVYPDLSAATHDEMDYIIFESYLTMDDMEEMDYDNLDDCQIESIPSNPLRHVRHAGTTDPLQDPQPKEYPEPGKYTGDNRKDGFRHRYRVWQCFYKKKGKIMFCVTNATYAVLVKEEESIYGDRYPVVMGLALTEAHKMLGEGLPEPLEGPQLSLNTNLNQRKDNISLILNRETFVSRYGNVDLQSLTNSRPGGITMMDDVQTSVKERDVHDVTRSSYLEASVDENMMQEMSGITPSKLGMEKDVKATVAQINLAEGNAKIDMYTAIVGETFVKSFYSLLAYHIQLFETDETIFRIANEALRQESQSGENVPEVYDLDFEADCVIEIGLGNVGRELEVQQTMLAIDRANMANQANIQLLELGVAPPQGVQMINTSHFFVELLPKLGKKDLTNYFYMLPPPGQQPQGEGAGGGAGMRGKMQPQMGNNDISFNNEGVMGGARATV